MLEFPNENINWLPIILNGVKVAYLIPPFINKESIAIDIGANVGAFPIVYSPTFKHIYCIEPSEHSYRECIKNISSLPNVTVFRYAAYSKSNETIKLMAHKYGNSSGNASTYINDEWNENEFEEVQTVSLEDLFTMFNLKTIDYLKVDCECAEYDFLMNKNLENIKVLGIELHIQLNEKRQELLDYLLQFFVIYNQNVNDSHIELTLINKTV